MMTLKAYRAFGEDGYYLIAVRAGLDVEFGSKYTDYCLMWGVDYKWVLLIFGYLKVCLSLNAYLSFAVSKTVWKCETAISTHPYSSSISEGDMCAVALRNIYNLHLCRWITYLIQSSNTDSQ